MVSFIAVLACRAVLVVGPVVLAGCSEAAVTDVCVDRDCRQDGLATPPPPIDLVLGEVSTDPARVPSVQFALPAPDPTQLDIVAVEARVVDRLGTPVSVWAEYRSGEPMPTLTLTPRRGYAVELRSRDGAGQHSRAVRSAVWTAAHPAGLPRIARAERLTPYATGSAGFVPVPDFGLQLAPHDDVASWLVFGRAILNASPTDAKGHNYFTFTLDGEYLAATDGNACYASSADDGCEAVFVDVIAAKATVQTFALAIRQATTVTHTVAERVEAYAIPIRKGYRIFQSPIGAAPVTSEEAVVATHVIEVDDNNESGRYLLIGRAVINEDPGDDDVVVRYSDSTDRTWPAPFAQPRDYPLTVVAMRVAQISTSITVELHGLHLKPSATENGTVLESKVIAIPEAAFAYIDFEVFDPGAPTTLMPGETTPVMALTALPRPTMQDSFVVATFSVGGSCSNVPQGRGRRLFRDDALVDDRVHYIDTCSLRPGYMSLWSGRLDTASTFRSEVWAPVSNSGALELDDASILVITP